MIRSIAILKLLLSAVTAAMVTATISTGAELTTPVTGGSGEFRVNVVSPSDDEPLKSFSRSTNSTATDTA